MFCNSITEKTDSHFKRKINTCMTLYNKEKKIAAYKNSKKMYFLFLIQMTNPSNYICNSRTCCFTDCKNCIVFHPSLFSVCNKLIITVMLIYISYLQMSK